MLTMLLLIFRSTWGQLSSSIFCSRIWIYRGDLSLCNAGRSEAFLSLFVSLSSPDHCPAPVTAWALLEETRSTSNATKPCRTPSCQPDEGDFSWTSALMRANFLSKHLKRGGAFSCHPLPGLILLSCSLWLEIKTRAFSSFNER